jgi:subtilisin family serine protease
MSESDDTGGVRAALDQTIRRATLAAAVLVLMFHWPASVPVGRAQELALVPQEMMQRARTQGLVRVIVELNVATQPEGVLAFSSQTLQRQAIAAVQNQLLAPLPVPTYRLMRQYTTIPFLALELTPEALAALGQSPLVRGIAEDQLDSLSLAQSVPLIQGPEVWAAGWTGNGWSVAVLDTGVDKTHSFLSGKVVEEACYSATSYCPNGLTSQVGAGASVPCTYAVSGCRHGTHVAGIATGTSASFSGVAKGASIIAVQVFSRFTGSTSCGTGESPCALSYVSDQIAGLERVYALRTTRQIAAVNMSLGGGKYTTQAACDAANASRKAIIDNLRSVGIATVISSGNNGYSDGMGAPGCISTAISVGSTTKTDAISSFSNSAAFLSLLAPGSSITSSIPGGAFAVFSGTSMAAPHVAGAWAIAKQQTPAAPVSTVLAAFRTSMTWITDSRNGVSVPRLELATALGAVKIGDRVQLTAETGVMGAPGGVELGCSPQPTGATGLVVDGPITALLGAVS